MSISAKNSVIGVAVVCVACAGAGAQQAEIVAFPPPASFFQNTTFAIDGGAGFVPTFDDDVLWSFSLATGELLDEVGLTLPAPATASTPAVFPNHRLAMGGWFPNQGVFVADISDPENLVQLGVIEIGAGTNIQGQNIAIDANGVVGYVASFPNDTLYSFNIDTMTLEDPNGLPLSANPDRIALAGNRLAMVDTSNGRIMVADVSDPSSLSLVGSIDLPGAPTFASNDNIVFADDGRTGFVSSNQRVLYSFDVVDLTISDPDGISFGTQQFGDNIAIHNHTVACIWSRGLAFIDVSDPTNMTLRSNAAFGGTVAPQGSATVAFSANGTKAAMPVIFPDHRVYTFDVATGSQTAPPFPVDDQPNFLTVYQPADRIGVLCSTAADIFLISGLLGLPGDFDGDGDVDLFDFEAHLDCRTGPGNTGLSAECSALDFDGDNDVDLADLRNLQVAFGSSMPTDVPH